MCQAVLSPNLTKKFQWKVSQIADNRFTFVMLLGGLSVNLNHLKMSERKCLECSVSSFNYKTSKLQKEQSFKKSHFFACLPCWYVKITYRGSLQYI